MSQFFRGKLVNLGGTTDFSSFHLKKTLLTRLTLSGMAARFVEWDIADNEQGNGGSMLPEHYSGERPSRIRQPRWREVWQIPLFLLGLVSCTAAWWWSPVFWPDHQAARARYQQILDALDQQNLEAARALFASLNQGKYPFKDYEIAYLEGNLYLAEAQQLAPLSVASPLAREAYLKAQVAFDKVIQAQLKDPPVRLHYQMALARLGTQPLDASSLIALEQTLESNRQDRLAGYSLLTDLRLKLQPPDDLGALRTLDLYLNMTERSQQHPQRILKAEILARLERWAEIPKTLTPIPQEATEYWKAIHWQALAAYHLKQWGEAVRLWNTLPPRDLTPQALLAFGHSQQQLKNLPEAQRLWERVWREYLSSPEALVAQSRLAELAMEQQRWHDAVRSLVTLLSAKKTLIASDSQFTPARLEVQVTQLANKLIQLRRWDDLRLLGDTAAPWSFQGKSDDWLSQAWHALAQSQPKDSPLPVPSAKAYSLAAEYAWKAAQQVPKPEKARLLWQSGQDALQAKSWQLAQRALGELLSLNPAQPPKPLILLALADALQEQKQWLFAADRLREALQSPGNHEAAIRLKLAQLLFLDDRQSEEAGKQLELAAGLVSRPESGPEARTACHQLATYLYNAVFVRRNVPALRAIQACERALQVAVPHPEAAQTRYMLAELLLAEGRPNAEIQLNAQEAVLRRQAEQLWQACKYFQIAADELARPEVPFATISQRDVFIRYARFGQAECWMNLGVIKPLAPAEVPSSDVCWQKAADLYESLISHSAHRVETLHAYLLLSKCYEKRGQFREMRETLEDARDQLKKLSDDELALPSRFSALKRSQWESLLLGASLTDRGQP